jgi:hypothetical protein
MSEPTISEALFEALCEEHGIACERIPSGLQRRTADYRLMLSGTIVVAEVKQLNPGPEDVRIARDLAERGGAAGCFSPGHRVRREIKSGYEQLRREAAERHPALLVLYDNTGGRTGFIAAHDVLVAMYGKEYVEMLVATPPASDIVLFRTGGNQGVTPTANRALSAIGVLRGWPGSIGLEVYHNRFAVRPLLPGLLRGARISHFEVTPPRQGEFLDWQVVSGERAV